MVMTGKSRPQGRPVAGFVDDGPVVPRQPPSTFGADHEVAVGVDDLAGPDHDLPPAGLAGDRIDVGDVLVARQRVADENGVRPRSIERAVGLVSDLKRREIDTAIEMQRLVGAETHNLRGRMIRLTSVACVLNRLHVNHPMLSLSAARGVFLRRHAA